MRAVRIRVVALAVCAALLALAGCKESDLTLADGTPGRTDGPPVTGDPSVALDDPDDVVDAALEDLRTYWDDAMPDTYGIAFEPLSGGLVPYGPTSSIPDCGPETLRYDDVAENALYCPADDYIAWDRVALIPTLQDQFGPLTIGVVMAHEYAHAVQSRADVVGATVTIELQADCFAGAWVADVQDRLATFSTEDDALDQAVAGLLELRDALGVAADDPQAHGSGFDRVGAFQDGYERGPSTCATYEDEPPPVVAMPFSSFDDQVQGGNLPLDQLIEPLVADLESFFTALLDELGATWDPVDDIVPLDPATDVVDCGSRRIEGDELRFAGFYCVDDDTVYLDNVELVPALDEIGDFAFGGELARLYGFAAQVHLGLAGDSRSEGLHADCLTGVFAAAEFLQQIPDQSLILSPGDLDEIIIAFLAFGGEADVSAFERTTAFRGGFVDGIAACDGLL